MSGFEQANMLLRGARDANDNIRDQNAANTREWEKTKKIDEAEKEGQSWYHGILDTAGAGTTMKSIYDTSQRVKTIGGGSYYKLAKVDAAKFTNKISGAYNGTIDSVKSGVNAASEKVGSTIENIGIRPSGGRTLGNVAGFFVPSSSYLNGCQPSVLRDEKPCKNQHRRLLSCRNEDGFTSSSPARGRAN